MPLPFPFPFYPAHLRTLLSLVLPRGIFSHQFLQLEDAIAGNMSLATRWYG